MKRLFSILAAFLLPLSVFAGGQVVVDTNTFVVLWPAGFFASNNVSTNTSGNTNVASYVSATNDAYKAMTNWVNISTNTAISYATNTAGVTMTNYVRSATNTTYINSTNAAYNAAYTLVTNQLVSSTNTDWIATTNAITTATNTVFTSSTNAAYKAMTNWVNAATNTAVITATNSAYIAMTNYVRSATNTWTYEYLDLTIVPINSTWEVVWRRPRSETFYIDDIWAQTDAGTVEFNMISSPSNQIWRAGLTTNNTALLTATVAGISSTNFSPVAVTNGVRYGIQIINVYGAQNLHVGARIHR